MTPRQRVLGGALAATLAATAWLALQPDAAIEPAVAALRPVRAPAASAAAVAASVPLRAPWAEASDAQLAAWQPPPPPPAAPAPPPAAHAAPPVPVAPPLPYQMIGRLVEGEGAAAVELALLNGPHRALSVRRGDVIDGQWRVEQVSSQGLSLVWLPGGLPQNLVFKQVP